MDLENIASKTNYGSGGSGLSDFFKTEGGESSRAGGSGVGGGGGGGGGRRDVEVKFLEPNYPNSADDDAPRFNIEHINKEDEEDEPVITGSRLVNKGKSSSLEPGMRPVRLHREEHKERVTIVNTGEEIKQEIKTEPKAVGNNSDSDVVMIDEERSTLLHNEPMAVHIKPEPVEESSLPPIKEPTSPEAKHSKAKGKGKEPVPGTEVDKKKRKLATKKRYEVPDKDATAEDKAEYARHLEDVRVLADELGGMQTRSQPGEDVAMEGTEAEVDQRHGRLYLFQFPGVLTKLYNPLTKKPEKAKGKGKEAEKDKDIEITSSTSNTAKKPQVKVEEGETVVKEEEEAVAKPEEAVDEVGAVGRMIVRKSGRVEMTWGSTDMVVQRGTTHGFLGAGYVIDNLDRMPVVSTDGTRIGMSTGMGEMMGKFVVVPDFEKTW